MTFSLAVCCLTTLSGATPGSGLPPDWELRGVRGAPRPTYSVTADGMLRVEGEGAAGFAIYKLPREVPPGPGMLRWRWRTGSAVTAADLREKTVDDSPIRFLVVFRDRRMLFYSWGNGERPGDWFPSWTSDDRIVWVLRTAAEADGAWREEARDPFLDYQTVFDREAVPIAAVGVVQDTDQLGTSAWAELGRIEWVPASNRN